MPNKPVREPIATWWRISYYPLGLDPLRVVAFTTKFVTFVHKPWTFSGKEVCMEVRRCRDDVFPTFAEAKAEAVRRATLAVESAEHQLQQARTKLGQWQSLTEEKPNA